MRTFEAIAGEIVALGVLDAFTFTAEDVVELVAELSLRGVKVHHTRHEHAAIAMADGYSRVSGRVGVAIVGAGVGLTNGINALMTAVKAHSNVVVIAGEVPGRESTAAQLQRKHVDQRGLLTALGVRQLTLDAATSVAADTRVCFALAEQGGETVVLGVPEEVMQATAGDGPTSFPDATGHDGPPDENVSAIVELLQAAERPLILAGRGAVRSGARAELLALADASRALLATTLMAKGFFAESPYSIGVLGGFATPLAAELASASDLVIAFGASLNFDTTGDGAMLGDAKVVQVDRHLQAIGRFQGVDLAVIGDAGRTATAILERLPVRDAVGNGFRTEDIARRIADDRLDLDFADQSGPAGLDPRTLMARLDASLPANRNVVVDGGSQKRYPVRYLSVPDETGFVWPTEYGSIGCGLGAALGAAVARPDRLTVLCVGDGALMMSLADLDTASRYALPLLIVVSNNLGLGAEYHHLVARGYAGDEMRYANSSFESIAKSMGFEARTIRTVADLEAVAPMLASVRGPMLLDCMVTIERVEPGWRVYARERARSEAAVS